MTESDVVVRVSNVSKRFVLRKEKSLKERLVNFGRSNRHKDDFMALNGVSLDITRGSTVGLIGPNGSGKSTLLKTIGGILQPTSGTVLRRGRLAALLELGAGFHPDLTGRENVYLNAAILGLSRDETDARFDDIVEFSGIEKFIDTQVKFYSSGMYVRLAFAVAVHIEPDVLIVDEVLAVGDEPFQRKCLDRIRTFQREGKTIIIVTHSLDVVAELCDRAVVLEAGKIVYDGSPDEALHVLRKDFETLRQEEQVDSQPVGIVPRITSTALSAAHISKTGVVDSGADLEITVEVYAPNQPDDLNIGIGIENSNGLIVFGTNTELLGVQIGPIQETVKVRFTLPEVRLGAGQYFYHSAVGTMLGGEVMRVPRAGTFQVREPTSNVGLISVSASAARVAP